VRTIATKSEAAGNGGKKNQRSVRVMNSNRWPPAIASQKIEMNEFAIEWVEGQHDRVVSFETEALVVLI